jgi:phosphomannomutase
VSREDLVRAYEELILSASGWRKVFAADRNEESATEAVRPVDLFLVALMALVYERFYRVRFPESGKPVIAVGIDTRDTGPNLADMIIRILVSQGVAVRYLFVAAAPEIMAYVGCTDEVDGFIYVSASHNPRGHNGVKFGFADGSVLGGEDAEAIRELFAHVVHDEQTVDTLREVLNSVDSVSRVYGSIEKNKRAALETYLSFIKTVVSGGKPEAMELLRSGAKLGLVADFNGSARTVSVDREFASELGIELRSVNDKPRQIAHQIVPEGAGLDQCRAELEKAHMESPNITFGYVPDNDGDRGNLVYIDDEGSAAPLQAQETFALSCVAELSWLVSTGVLTYSPDGRAAQKVAIVVNGPTSMRIDRIAAAFDASVYRAEVGEANVVGLARILRTKGFIVPILGEGSNGGNITQPSTVRDPLATVGAVAKLLVASAPGRSPFEIWLAQRRSARRPEGVTPDEAGGEASRDESPAHTGSASTEVSPSIPGILRSLPQFQTTSAFEPVAKLSIRSTDHAALKSEYERVFKASWAEKKAELSRRFGIRSWVVINYEGTNETHGVGSRFRSGAERGGFKVLFKNGIGTPVAFLWMRGSGTEPVFRVMADVESESPDDEAYLLNWHREMIDEADRAAAPRR